MSHPQVLASARRHHQVHKGVQLREAVALQQPGERADEQGVLVAGARGREQVGERRGLREGGQGGVEGEGGELLLELLVQGAASGEQTNKHSLSSRDILTVYPPNTCACCMCRVILFGIVN